MIINFHTHIFPDKIADGAITKLSEAGKFKSYAQATASALTENMINFGVAYSVILPIATSPHQQKSVNDFASGCVDRLIGFGSVNPHAEDALFELERIKKLGLKGIKLHPEYQSFDADDEKLAYPIYRLAAELKLPVSIHAGFDVAFLGSLRAAPEKLARALAACPDTVFILAHMGGMGPDMTLDNAFSFVAGKNCYLDTSLCSIFFDKGIFMKFAAKHGTEKMLFGTDYPWTDTGKEIAFIESLPITAREKDNIFYNNAAQLLNL